MSSVPPTSPSFNIPSSSSTPFPFGPSPATERRNNFTTWLMQVAAASKPGSEEGEHTLWELAQAVPDSGDVPREMQEIVAKIRQVAESHKHDPDLSPESLKALKPLMQQLTTREPITKSGTARRLF